MNKEIVHILKMISKRLKDKYDAKTVILSGSYSRGEETADSDVDLLIIAPGKETFMERIASVKCIIRDLRNGLPVAPIVLTQEETDKRRRLGDQFIMDILENGVSL